jgi:hypothetical protein
MFKIKFSETFVYKFLKSIISENESVSSKRVVALLAFLTIEIVAFVNLFTGKSIQEFIFDGLIMLALGGLGITAVEKILKKGSPPS